MLARKYLVPLKTEFGRLRRQGKIYDSDSFGLLVAYGAEIGPKAAFVVSKKVDRRSVVRHAVKRKLSDGVSFFFPHLAKNLELVFLAKQKAATINKDELQKEISTIFNRARLVVPPVL